LPFVPVRQLMVCHSHGPACLWSASTEYRVDAPFVWTATSDAILEINGTRH
jgi:hypothetical protein